MSGNPNPFVYSRREQESDTIIYVTGGQGGFLEWISDRQCLFEGLRGSGKSSILKSMEWDVAWKLSDTRVAGPAYLMKDIPEQPDYLGVRFRFELMDTKYWDEWKTHVGEGWAQRYFGTYLQYLLLDLFLNALVGIMPRVPELVRNEKAERHLLEEILQLSFPQPGKRPRLPEQSFECLSRLLRDQHVAIRHLVYGMEPIQAMQDSYPVLSPGELIQRLGETLITSYVSLSNLRLFPLLDDCNHLADWQVQVVNSAIVRASAPISYKVTSVSGLYKSRRTVDGRPVGEHELKTMQISGASEAGWTYSRKFERLVEGVCRTRVERCYNEELASKFDFKRILGDFDIEDLLYRTLSASENPRADKLLRRAQRMKGRKEGSRVSITSAWLSQVRLKGYRKPSHPDAKVQKKLLRRLKSIYTKKWNHAAAVAICHDMRRNFPYAGWRMVLHLSGGSMREVLRIMSEMWMVADIPVEGFLGQQGLDYRKQRRAIENAAKSALEAIGKEPLFGIEEEVGFWLNTRLGSPYISLPVVCRRLGKLFSKFQSYPYVGVTPESASLKVSRDEMASYLVDAIDHGVMAGAFLKLDSGSSITVGLHPILSPLFDISYRNPFYYPETISAQDFSSLFAPNRAGAGDAIERILAGRLRRYAGYEGPAAKEPATQIGMALFESASRGE